MSPWYSGYVLMVVLYSDGQKFLNHILLSKNEVLCNVLYLFASHMHVLLSILTLNSSEIYFYF